MKKVLLVLLTTMITLAAAATAPLAGVRLAQVVTSQGPDGSTTQQQTVYVQGNKLKVETPDAQTITDLDEHLLFVIDEYQHGYIKIPLSSAQLPTSADLPAHAIKMKKTEEKRVIANHLCEEYRGIHKSNVAKLAVSACVSDNVPGSKELESFDKRAIEELGGVRPDQENILVPGIALEARTVLTTRIPSPIGKDKLSASSMSETRVTDIQEQELPANTFLPSADLRELKPQQRVAPSEQDRGDGLSI